MADVHRLIAAAIFAALFATGAIAQQTAAPAAPQGTKPASVPQDLEPSVDTSAPAAAGAEPPATSAPRSKASPAPSTKPASAHTAPAGSADAPAKSNAKDRMALDPTQITGNRELPKVLYIVPWKHSDLSDLAGRPANSLLDEVLAPVDRDVFQRENRYYGALQPDAPRAGNVPVATPPRGAPAAGAAAPPARDEK